MCCCSDSAKLSSSRITDTYRLDAAVALSPIIDQVACEPVSLTEADPDAIRSPVP